MADVFTVLAQDHEEVKRMLAELEKGPTRATGASQDQLALRKKMTEQLIIEESKHEALEEMYFWPVVRDHLPDGDTLADQATGQEQEAKEVLAKLDKLDADDAEFEELLGMFIEAARKHIRFEETAVWPGLRIALNTQRAAELGTQIGGGKKTAPTRPHPHTPPSPGALKTAGPIAAAADRARDAATGRATRQPGAATDPIRPRQPSDAGTGRQQTPQPVRQKGRIGEAGLSSGHVHGSVLRRGSSRYPAADRETR